MEELSRLLDYLFVKKWAVDIDAPNIDWTNDFILIHQWRKLPKNYRWINNP